MSILLQISITDLCACTIPFSLHRMQVRADNYPAPPHGYYCSTCLGFKYPAMAACLATWQDISRRNLSCIFVTQLRTSTNDCFQVLQSYAYNKLKSQRTTTIDLDGHSETDEFVLVPYDVIRDMTQDLVTKCVTGQMGGRMTYGMKGTLDSLLKPTAYDGSALYVPLPAVVEQPDGNTGLFVFPPPAVGLNVPDGGYSESLPSNPVSTACLVI